MPSPKASTALPRIEIRGKGAERLRAGHPWILRNDAERAPKDLPPGSLVDLVDSRGAFLARGYWNANLFLCGRVLSRTERPIDAGFFRERLKSSLAYRHRIYPKDRTYRWIFSEGDLLPGLIVDRYESAVSVQTLTAGMDKFLPDILSIVEELAKPEILILRNDASSREQEGLPLEKKVLKGTVSGPMQVGIHSYAFEVDLIEGYKTGFYLDQKENWKYLRPFVEGKRVLDAFCYSGAFGIAAARFGAKEVLGIDFSAEATAWAARNATLNGVGEACKFQTGNAFDLMREMGKAKQQFDVVVLDPPSFTRRKNKLPDALRGYKEIHLQAMRLLPPGGVLLTFTCSYHVTREIFRKVIAEAAADLGRSCVEEILLTQSRDHPVRLEIPETEYLKGMILRVE